MSGQSVQKVYADPLNRNACLRTAFLLGHFLGFLDPDANFSKDQEAAMHLALDKDSLCKSSSISDLLRARIFESNVTGADLGKTGLDFLSALDTNNFLEKFEPVLSQYVNATLLEALQGSSVLAELNSRSEEFRSALRASLKQDHMPESEVDRLSDLDLIEKFSGPSGYQSCYVHMEVLSSLFKTQIITHESVAADGSTYALQSSATGQAHSRGEVCHLLGGAGHFDLMTQRAPFSSALMSNYHNVSAVQAVQLVSPFEPAPIPAVVASAVRGGGGPAALRSQPGLLSRAIGTVTGAVTGLPSAVWSKLNNAIRGSWFSSSSAAASSAPAPSQSRASAVPASRPSASSASSGVSSVKAVKKTANPNNDVAVATKALSEGASTQKSDASSMISQATTLIASLDRATAKKTGGTAASSMSATELAEISKADDYIAAVYQAALLKNPNASFDEVSNQIRAGTVAQLLGTDALKQAVVFYEKYKATPSTVKDSAVAQP